MSVEGGALRLVLHRRPGSRVSMGSAVSPRFVPLESSRSMAENRFFTLLHAFTRQNLWKKLRWCAFTCFSGLDSIESDRGWDSCPRMSFRRSNTAEDDWKALETQQSNFKGEPAPSWTGNVALGASFSHNPKAKIEAVLLGNRNSKIVNRALRARCS